ncbi:uncharacterized protein LOC129741145 [Uranotaenia lowii]|uniref:uncharacterized protein LOC129741145 n=1 Tax=Uranotaenia lowii TaxID=190385 RepID=UPI00247865B2|nr:uncharacterized protein LOC129741145 [Uranotaenia lowii]
MTGRNGRADSHFEEEDESNCATCNRPDSEEDMVQCDACDAWHHYTCAGVDVAVANLPWICGKCMNAKDDDAASVHSHSSSILSASLSQMMDRQELEREKADLEVQRRHLDERQKLLLNAAADKGLNGVPPREHSNRSVVTTAELELPCADPKQPSCFEPSVVRSAISPFAGALGLASNRIPSHLGVATSIADTSKSPQTSVPVVGGTSSSPTVRSTRQHHVALHELKASVEKCESSDKLSPEQLHDLKRQLDNCRRLLAEYSSDVRPDQLDMPRQTGATRKIARNLPTVPEEHRRPKPNNKPTEYEEEPLIDSVWQVKQSVSQSGFPPFSKHPVNSSQAFHQPTPQQLVARQSLGKELPNFSGDPTEWPIFISNYEFTTDACGFSNGENMLRLQRCLTGAALEAVRSRLVLPAGVPQVRAIPVLRSDRLEGLINFGDAVQTLCDHIEAANEHAHLSNPSLLQELVSKLPSDQQMRWARFRRGFSNVNLKTFNEYIDLVAEDASSVVPLEPDSSTRVSGRERTKSKAFVNSHAEETLDAKELTEPVKEYVCAHCDQVGHRIVDCRTFKALNVEDRWRKIRDMGLCQNCLYNHGRRSCRLRQSCNIDNCQHRHHRLLHPTKVQSSTVTVAEIHIHRNPHMSSLFRIIPVKLFGKLRCVETFAFLDEGSDLTLVENELANDLGATGDKQPLCLKWTGNTSRLETDSQRISLQISGANQDKQYTLMNARTVKSLDLPYQTFRLTDALKTYTYLKGVPISSYVNAKPRILIGIDNLRLALPLKVKEGDSYGPVAVKTRLGWCVYGPRSNREEANSFHICKCSCENDLQESVKKFFTVESSGTSTVNVPLSEEEQRALTLLESSTTRIGNRYETGLLFKNDYVEFPDSYRMAETRLACLERRMQRNPELRENLHRQIQEYESKGYAHKATKCELEAADPRRIWYLPIGVVVNPKKPGKIRIIWDAAAKTEGISLNSALLKGPDQLVSLPGVLFRFRQYRVGVTSDIQEMFHQIRIRKEDTHSQRFLWRADPTEKPSIYLMDVATFGSTCSPASAQFVKNRNAEIHAQLYPEAATAIIRDHYVDDYLASFESEEEALRVSRDVRLVHELERSWNKRMQVTGDGSRRSPTLQMKLPNGEVVHISIRQASGLVGPNSCLSRKQNGLILKNLSPPHQKKYEHQ